jgi:hypothetical protein
MTTITYNIPENAEAEISELVLKNGGRVLATSKDGMTEQEQLSLNQALKEAKMIEKGTLKSLSFDELWDE